MRHLLGATLLSLAVTAPAFAGEKLQVVYPVSGHTTTAAKIFFIGSAPPDDVVTINGQAIANRSPSGNFAPSLPLDIGDNTFTLRYRDQTLTLTITRKSTAVAPPTDGFAQGSLTPSRDIARQPQEPICFSAIAPTPAQVSVTLGGQTVALSPQSSTTLPANSAALTAGGSAEQGLTVSRYQGCTAFARSGSLGKPTYTLRLSDQTVTQVGAGTVEILSPAQFDSIAVTSAQGVARTGPSTNYSRLTPLPQGTQARITGREGEWLRLDYGGWIKAAETQALPTGQWPQAIIRSFRARERDGWTEVRLPLTTPVPVSLEEGKQHLTLTLHNTTAQTDINVVGDDPVIDRLDWQQVAPGQAQYRINFKQAQQWGYKLNYDGNTLVLALKHPPRLSQAGRSLAGVKILLDPGHGGNELGAVGPTGIPEKTVNLQMSLLMKAALEARGAEVVLTRDRDVAVSLRDRVRMVQESNATLAFSIHNNALPDSGDALNTAGIGTFWYHTQSHDLSRFLYRHFTETLDRPRYGIFWDNLALTRPTAAPILLLELGFMSNPVEYEWITDPRSQQQLAETLADGLQKWLGQQVKN